MGKYFGTDGVRGRANEQLTLDMAVRIGQWLGWYYSKSKTQCQNFNWPRYTFIRIHV